LEVIGDSLFNQCLSLPTPIVIVTIPKIQPQRTVIRQQILNPFKHPNDSRHVVANCLFKSNLAILPNRTAFNTVAMRQSFVVPKPTAFINKVSVIPNWYSFVLAIGISSKPRRRSIVS
jgi:hypothetical protein